MVGKHAHVASRWARPAGTRDNARVLPTGRSLHARHARRVGLISGFLSALLSALLVGQTAARRVGTSRDLLESATQSERVAYARYKEGVGNLLDLLSAQSALALARAQEIQSRSDWLIAVARLARDTGTLATAVTETEKEAEVDAAH